MMKTRLWAVAIVVIGCVAAVSCVTYQVQPGVRPAPAPAPVSYEPPVAQNDGSEDQPFYDDLSPYGRWNYVDGPGWVWSPTNVQADWRPYQMGHWVFTDAGWTWASDEAFGSVVFHYGRWNNDPRYGWIWVPGTEWGPAWVAWHEGGGYVGWAPLPSQVRVRVGVGLDWGGVNISIQPNLWCFVGTRYLVEPTLRTHIMPPARNVTLIQVTRNITNYTYVDNRIVNQGVRVETVGRAVGRTIPRYHLADSDAGEAIRGGKVRGEDFVVYRPDPSRGRHSQGRLVPPGHDPEHHGRDFRSERENAPNGPDMMPPQQEPGRSADQSAPASGGSDAQQNAPNRNQQMKDAKHDRGHGFLDRLVNRNQRGNGRGPSGTGQANSSAAPGQSNGQGSGATGQGSQPGQGGQSGQGNTPAQGNSSGQGAQTGQRQATPQTGSPSSGTSQPDRGRGRNFKNVKPAKTKPDAPKPAASDDDKAKSQ